MLEVIIVDSQYLFNEFIKLYYVNNFDKFIDKDTIKIFIGKLPNKKILLQQMQATIYSMLHNLSTCCLSTEILLATNYKLDSSIINFDLNKLYLLFVQAVKQLVAKQLDISINYTEYSTEIEHKKVVDNLTAISKGCELKYYHL